MRLEKIKLAGFKSFVDPTTIEFPSNLVGIVGPNGCGKSNIIDAIRWVMGESSAKYLRGESIADVIFNGSAHRKPLGKASIEMIFDNRDGRLGGEFAQYSQISIRREIDREAQSHYFLNGAHCRRRDILDVFYGTGLSSRGYAIIEQGMINRIIEAKPQDLRVNFEEVAGISKYKERRRETETRIGHTKENLARILDVIEELEKQLDRLKRQARTAERYKELKESERTLKGQLLTLKVQNLEIALKSQDQLLLEGEALLQSKIADQQHAETNLIKLREEKNELLNQQSNVQERSYHLGTEINRLEQVIQHHKSRHKELSDDLAQTQQTLNSSQGDLDSDQAQMIELEAEVTLLAPELNTARQMSETAQGALKEAEQILQQWQQQWDQFHARSAKSSQTAEIERTRIHHLEQKQQDMAQRLKKFSEERNAINYSELEEAHESLRQQLSTHEEALQVKEYGLKSLQDKYRSQREQNQQSGYALDQLRSRLQQARGRVASLEALQQAALGQKSGAVKWLEQHHLSDKPRLAQCLKVDASWETATEVVLGNYLEAVCLDNFDTLQSVLGSFSQGNLTFLDTTKTSQGISQSARFTRLQDKIHTTTGLGDLLRGIYVADDLGQAIQMRHQLAPEESVVTSDGVWLGPNWLRVLKDRDAKSGVLQREQELKTLKTHILDDEQALKLLEEKMTEGQQQLTVLEEQIHAAQQQLNQVNAAVSTVKAQLHVHQKRVHELKSRGEYLDQEAKQLEAHIVQAQQDLQRSREALELAINTMEQDTREREILLEKKEGYRQQLSQTREHAQKAREHTHTLEIRYQTTKSQLEALSRACERIQKQCIGLEERIARLTEELAQGFEPLEGIQANLDECLAKRLLEEEQLKTVKQTVSEVMYQEQQFEDQRKEDELAAQEVREALEDTRLKVQEYKVRRATLMEQLVELEYDINQLIETLPQHISEEEWSKQLETTVNKISNLGPINLAAIQELDTEMERKTYLDKQRQDLEEALATLENAIRKIDQETRARFREMFDKINEIFQELFPRIFGGGKAYLELTEDNLLDAGVVVMARPPGKKNSTIHLLSGGEKALTAIALIFSMFHLNPAPFCMLDEVDAPLDDANVLRYSKLVKEMSAKVQFMFITHNKITMEIADQLIGVTMNEPGVSRIVAVDVEKAVEMVEA